MSAYVYAMVREDGAIKIGHTMYPKERLATVGALSFLGIEEHAYSIDSRNREKALHRELAVWRLDGEWFSPSPEVMTVARALGSPNPPQKTTMLAVRIPHRLHYLVKCFAAENDDTVAAFVARSLETSLAGYEVKR